MSGRIRHCMADNTYTLSQTCPVCGSHDLLQHGYTHRLWREVPIGPKPIVIQMGIPRVECRKCATIRQVAVGFADERGLKNSIHS